MTYSLKVTLLKGLASFASGLAMVLITGLVGYLSDSEALSAALRNAGWSDALLGLLLPLLKALATMLRNWSKNGVI